MLSACDLAPWRLLVLVCVAQIDMPDYSTRKIMADRLLLAAYSSSSYAD